MGFPKETLYLQAPSVYSWSERNSLLKCCAMLISHLAILTAPVERAFPTVPSCRSDLPTKDAGMNTGHKSEELNVEPESFCPSKPIILGTISLSVTFSGKPRETESHGEFLFLLQSLLGPLGALEHLKNLFVWSAWIYGVFYSSFWQMDTLKSLWDPQPLKCNFLWMGVRHGLPVGWQESWQHSLWLIVQNWLLISTLAALNTSQFSSYFQSNFPKV